MTGPYLDRNDKPMLNGGGTEVLSTHGLITVPGHPAVLQDGDETFLVYHYYNDSRQPATGGWR